MTVSASMRMGETPERLTSLAGSRLRRGDQHAAQRRVEGRGAADVRDAEVDVADLVAVGEVRRGRAVAASGAWREMKLSRSRNVPSPSTFSSSEEAVKSRSSSSDCSDSSVEASA